MIEFEIREELSRNDLYVLKRAIRRADGSSALLKGPRRLPATAVEFSLLENEFELLRELSIPGVPRALEFLPDGDGPFIVLEDFGATPLRTATLRKDLECFLTLAIRLCRVLDELHRHGIAHCRISPDSVLVGENSVDVQLIDFSCAAQLGIGSHSPGSEQIATAFLPYCSPEQTGRVNRHPDHRTDFYSLGATFYELLLGSPSFQSLDQMELIHWHIARQPQHPRDVDGNVPEALSDIILKLLAKAPEDRYQTARGLAQDLETCLLQWTQSRRIPAFALGRNDVSDHFVVPQRLYGREREIQQLSSVFESTCQGKTALALVAGYSGVGKTSLVQELYRPIVRQRGYFMSGKFDQVARNIPFGALTQAFRGLLRQLLSETDARRRKWQSDLNAALGSNAGVVTELIPELEWMVGRQSPPAALGPAETQNRFQLVFRNLLQVLARPDHPLIIFLDDLQWADAATLSLLEPVLTSPEIQRVLLIGAYRDNEVGAGHPLVTAVSRIEAAGAAVHRVALRPLALEDVQALVGDTLRRGPEEVAALARLVVEKTEGNPFFVIQFIKSLYQEKLIEFNRQLLRWDFQMEAIAAAPMTENVIDLMTREIKRLPRETTGILSFAACIGNEFDLETLAVITDQPLREIAEKLRAPLRQGLILPATGRQVSVGRGEDSDDQNGIACYCFLHDRVQQAAYALIPDQRRTQVHLQVGRLLLKSWGAENEEKLFDIIQHLNLGRGMVSDDDERMRLAKLNLAAGRKSKSSAAYQAALEYFRTALELLAGSGWDTQYDLLFALHLEEAECAYLCGFFEDAERRFALLLERARTAVDKAEVQHLRLVQYENRSRYADAVQCGEEGLALLGVILPDEEGEIEAALEDEIASIESLLNGRPVESLVNLPLMEDVEKRLVMRMLTSIWAPAYITGNQILTRLISATIVRLSLAHGITEESAYGYVTHAITVGPVRGDYRSAYQWGSLALQTDERFASPKQRAKIHQQFHAHVVLWRRPLEEAVPHAREACRVGLEAGDFNYAAYGAFTESWASFLTCRELGRFVREQSSNLDFLEKMKMTDPLRSLMVIVNWAQALRGGTAGNLSLSTEDFDEGEYGEAYAARSFFLTPYYAMKLSLCLMFEAYEKALETARRAREAVHALSGTIWPVFLDFLYGLTLTALYPQAQEQQRQAWISELAPIRQSLAFLAENCPENYLGFSVLVEAELKRVQGLEAEAMRLYEKAIDHAASRNSVWHGAWAAELYSRFWRNRGNEAVADLYLQQAYRGYQKWGAAAKTAALEQQHPGLAAQPPDSVTASLDVSSLAKAARAVAQELELENLLRSLMKIALENAGAQRGLFLAAKEGDLVIEAEQAAAEEEATVLQSIPVASRSDLAHSVVHYVLRTGETVVLGNAAADEGFSADPYIASVPILSILCLPLIHHRKAEGVLYLENRLSAEVFTPERAKVLQMVAAQAAISLENARLYERAKREAAERQRAEETLRSVVEGTAAATGADFFRSLVQHLAAALHVRYAFVAECSADKTRVRTLAFWKGGGFSENTEYDVASTPCRTVLEGEVGFYPSGVQDLFPADRDLLDLKAESYVGVPIRSARGHVIGHLAVLDQEPLQQSPLSLSVLMTFSARAGAEMDRLRAEEKLKAALVEVEQLKNQLQAENIYLQEEIRREHNFQEIVGGSPALLELLAKVERVAPTDATVLICGETGTGKELIARAIHSRSDRRHRPLVKVNCGAISAGLVESELFGHVRGAFTGAVERRTGRFELAHGGTIFLDEVGELPPETQVKLLRVLQEQEFEPVGSSRTVRVDVRIIAATNLDLQQAVDAGRFRADLFYRLNVLPLKAPPLRDRTEDIPQLVMFFLAHFSNRFGKKVDRVSQETLERLVRYPWPGNIRELQNVIERAVVLAQGSVLVLDQNLLPQPTLRPPAPERSASRTSADGPATAEVGENLPPPGLSAWPPSTPPATLEQVEREHILRVLADTDWVIEGPKGAARILKLHPNTLRSRLKKLGIRRPSHEMP